MDLRGRGRSDKPESGYSLELHVEDIRSAIDDLGLKEVVLMGHSLGAFISLAFCAKHPERVDRMILVDGGGALSKQELDKVFQGIKPALDGPTTMESCFRQTTTETGPYSPSWKNLDSSWQAM